MLSYLLANMEKYISMKKLKQAQSVFRGECSCLNNSFSLERYMMVTDFKIAYKNPSRKNVWKKATITKDFENSCR